jgi:hypothetical protein
MTRRKSSLFNLSFLDLLSGALGAVIFLFIITPKGGGEAAATTPQLALRVDTLSGQFWGDLPDSLRHKRIGDTLLTVLIDYRILPGVQRRAKPEPVVETPDPRPAPPETRRSPVTRPEPEPDPQPTPPVVTTAPPPEQPREPAYRGDAPSVPCRVSFEITWATAESNVDLFVCKGDQCVYGGRKRDRDIGDWDSGKSRNRLFGNDLRTNQEAVRQFDEVIPGEYQLYATFKESEQERTSINISGLIYTRDDQGFERGTEFARRLPLGEERVLLGTVIIQPNGQFQFVNP